MRNEDLDKLTDAARELAEGMPSLLLNGDGQFVSESGRVCPPHELLGALSTARRRAAALYQTINAIPRRKIGAGGSKS